MQNLKLRVEALERNSDIDMTMRINLDDIVNNIQHFLISRKRDRHTPRVQRAVESCLAHVRVTAEDQKTRELEEAIHMPHAHQCLCTSSVDIRIKRGTFECGQESEPDLRTRTPVPRR